MHGDMLETLAWGCVLAYALISHAGIFTLWGLQWMEKREQQKNERINH